MTGLAIERNKGLLVPDTQKLLRTLKADIEDANRVRKGGKRLVADLRTLEPSDRRLRNPLFMFDECVGQLCQHNHSVSVRQLPNPHERLHFATMSCPLRMRVGTVRA